MYEINVAKRLEAPVDKVFARFADHANYDSMPGIVEAELLREGGTERNGVGARRRIKTGAALLIEDITEFEPNRRLSYRIVASQPIKLRHEGGSMTFIADGQATEVKWISRFSIGWPVVGGLVESLLGRQFAKAFAGTLRAVEHEIQQQGVADVSQA